jgi:cyclophilin family peptidyl-prolyl cis-trans isomerase
MVKNCLLTIILCALGLHSFAQKHKLKIRTSMGTIIVKLYDDVPLHTANYVKLAKEHTLDSTLFHRVIQNFMIQGGDPTTKHSKPDTTYGDGDLPYRIPAEIMPDKHCHKRGVMAAARDDNPSKESSACQFYIVQGKIFTEAGLDSAIKKRNLTVTPERRKVYTTVGGTPHLDGNYTVFGEVIRGYDVVEKIAATPTNKQYGDRPVTDVRIYSVRLKKKWLFF